MVFNPAVIPLIAAAIPAIAKIGGGLLSKGSGTGTTNRKAARGQIRGAVQGANEAGLHPLAVLGGGYGGFPAPQSPMLPALTDAATDFSAQITQGSQRKGASTERAAQNAEIAINNASSRKLQGAQADYWGIKALSEAQSMQLLTTVRNNPAAKSTPSMEELFAEVRLLDREGKFATYFPNPEVTEGQENLGPQLAALVSILTSGGERERLRGPKKRSGKNTRARFHATRQMRY